jgi:hypothetical protein
MTLEKADDIRHESEAQAFIGSVWGCTFRSFGKLSPIDWSIHKNGRLVAVAEFKRRNRSKDSFDTVFLNLQKWMSLSFVSLGLEVPALFIVQFSDCMGYVDISKIDPKRHRVCGRTDRNRESDFQPVIEIDTWKLKILIPGTGNNL